MSATCKVNSVIPPTNNKLVTNKTIKMLRDLGNPRLSNQEVIGNKSNDKTSADASNTRMSLSQIIPITRIVMENNVAAKRKAKGYLWIM
jgi:hypothetical protein